MRHQCHALRCRVSVSPKLLMCLGHWRKVPSQQQRAVWAAYVDGQEIRKDPSDAYMVAHYDAVLAVADAEELTGPDVEETRRLLDAFKEKTNG